MGLAPHIDWNYPKVKITDVRKLNKLYAIKIEDPSMPILLIKDTIFEERLKSYYLMDMSKLSRFDILGLNWNMLLTKGYYIKVGTNGEISKYGQRIEDKDKWFVSYLEIDGPLGTFDSIHKEKVTELF